MGCTPTHPPHTIPGYRPPLSADRGEAHSMTTQQGPFRSLPLSSLGQAGAHAGDRLGIPTPDTATTDQGREAGRWGRPTLQSAHAAYASHTFLCGRPRPQAVSRSGQRMQGGCGASASPVGSRVGAQHPQSRIRHLLCFPS